MFDKFEKDRRARKSIDALWHALFDLMKFNDWDSISIQMITDRADVARSTFYAHFQTKQDLLEAGFAMLDSGVRSQVLSIQSSTGRLVMLDWLIVHIKDNREFLKHANGTVAGQIIQGRFRRIIQSLLVEELSASGRIPAGQDLLFLTAGIFAVTTDWAAKGCQEDPDSLSASLTRQVFAFLGT